MEISQADLDLIISEFEIAKNTAERKLREAGGDVEKAMQVLLTEPDLVFA